MRRSLAGLVIAAAASAAPLARAQSPRHDVSLVDSCPNVGAEVGEAEKKRALEHYDRGAVLYEQGDYESAVDEFVAAYCDAPHPLMFFNIGQSFERLLDFETAINYFERFIIESAPGAVNLKRARVRVRVLSRLPARIRVATVPSGAEVSVRLAEGLAASGRANDKGPILVEGGSYTLEVEAPGYERVTQKVELAIGQPYSYYFQLERKKGVLRVEVEPRTSRIFIDDRLVGLGSYSETVDIGRYRVRVEASKREPISREVIVNADRTTDETFRLPEPEGTGRWQLVTAGGAMGLFAGTAALSNIDLGDGVSSLLLVGGLGLGVGSALIAVPRDFPISRTSFIITTGIIGGLEVGLTSALFLCDINTAGDDASCNSSAILGAATGGLLGGVIFGAVTAPQFKLDAGDAAILNSGMLWGTAVGGLFFEGFDANENLVVPLLLAGLNLGVATGAVLGTRSEVSRRRVALIDLSGIAGATVGFAAASALEAKGERVAHSALVGVGVGLIAGTFLTRFFDEPEGGLANVEPTTSTVRDAAGSSTTTLGARLRY